MLPCLQHLHLALILSPGVDRPVRVATATEFFRLVPAFTESTISHSFPSIGEGKVYCAALGIRSLTCSNDDFNCPSDFGEWRTCSLRPGMATSRSSGGCKEEMLRGYGGPCHGEKERCDVSSAGRFRFSVDFGKRPSKRFHSN